MTFKALTIGRLKIEIKDLPDDMPIYLENDEDYIGCLSIEQRTLSTYDLDADEEAEIKALVLGIE